jgi:UDP-N-acetylmuramoyl-L-alanyl-D-glutamate--2,6-diaminopimelate ligase
MGSSRDSVHVVIDRREAIERAIGMARPGDAVVIAGKGHESTQTIGDTVVDFDDVLVAREIVGVAT